MTSTNPPVDLDRWRPLQEALVQVLGLNIGLIDAEGNALTRPADLLRSPWNVLTSSARGLTRYMECVQTLLSEARNNPQPLVSMQVGGLHLSVVPVEQGKHPAGFFLVGPCLVGRRGEPDDYIALAKEFDIPIDRWMEALQEIKVFSFVGLNAVGSLLQQLGGLAFPPQLQSKAVEQDEAWAQLLETAIRAVNAQAGSILVRGKQPDLLVIRVARGLDPEVVRTTRLRVGEGVAGTAAAEQIPFRINNRTTHPRLQGLLKRPQIQDAMVVPLLRRSDLLGVLCVSTSHPGGRLREDGLDLLQQLTQLAQGSLS